MKQRTLFISLITGLFILLSGALAPTYSYANEFSFGVTPLIPENQIDKDKTYFDLRFDPGQKETVYVQLQNDLDREVKVDVSLSPAFTNSNVIVEYSKANAARDQSLKYDLSKLVEAPPQVALAPHSAVKVPFAIQMPDTGFKGVIAGGITFKEEQDENKPTKDSSQGKGLAIENEYSYVVALLMRQNTEEVAPNLQLHEVKPSQLNARNVIMANIQNDRMTYINQVTVDAEITEKGASQVLYQDHKDTLQIAPNTNFDFPVPLKGEALQPGDYHIKLIVNGNKNPAGTYTRGKDAEGKDIHFLNQWVMEKDFTITGDVADELNAKDVTIKPDNTWLFLLIGLILLLMALLILWLLIKRRKKNEEEEWKAE